MCNYKQLAVCRTHHKTMQIEYIKLWDSIHLVILPC